MPSLMAELTRILLLCGIWKALVYLSLLSLGIWHSYHRNMVLTKHPTLEITPGQQPNYCWLRDITNTDPSLISAHCSSGMQGLVIIESKHWTLQKTFTQVAVTGFGNHGTIVLWGECIFLHFSSEMQRLVMIERTLDITGSGSPRLRTPQHHSSLTLVEALVCPLPESSCWSLKYQNSL